MPETPFRTIWKLLLQVIALFRRQKRNLAQDTEPHLNACIKTAIEMGFIHALNKSEGAKTATELASITGGDKIPAFQFQILSCWLSATHSLQSAS